MARILIIDDDKMMAECFAYALKTVKDYEISTCAHAIAAMEFLDHQFPDLIVLDILLDGPDGFSFLNELISYPDTMKIPVIIVSSLDLTRQNLSHYGVVGILQKETMTPEQLLTSVKEALQNAQ